MVENNHTKDELRVLAERLLEIQVQAKQLGIFVDDRDLVECVDCQLIEDIALNGRLFTFWKNDKDSKDTGLQFIELNQSEALFQCPNCGKQATAQKEKDC